jgi:hypothetical protein
MHEEIKSKLCTTLFSARMLTNPSSFLRWVEKWLLIANVAEPMDSHGMDDP